MYIKDNFAQEKNRQFEGNSAMTTVLECKQTFTIFFPNPQKCLIVKLLSNLQRDA